LAENVTVDELSERLRLRPDGGGAVRTEIAELAYEVDGPMCSWIVRSHADPRAPAGEHLAELLERLEPCKSAMLELVQKGAIVEATVCTLADGFAVPFELTPDLAQRVADLSARLVVYLTPERRWFALAAHLDYVD
jgi:hypothetical protein